MEMMDHYETINGCDSFEADIKVENVVDIVPHDSGTSDSLDDIIAYLKVAERLVERAGYHDASLNEQGNVVELMLVAAKIGRIADAMASRGSGLGATGSCD